jgi:hypothetical protein
LPGLAMKEIINTLDVGKDIFYIATAIFVYEKSNNLSETRRCWNIDNLTVNSDLLVLKYT